MKKYGKISHSRRIKTVTRYSVCSKSSFEINLINDFFVWFCANDIIPSLSVGELKSEFNISCYNMLLCIICWRILTFLKDSVAFLKISLSLLSIYLVVKEGWSYKKGSEYSKNVGIYWGNKWYLACITNNLLHKYLPI